MLVPLVIQNASAQTSISSPIIFNNQVPPKNSGTPSSNRGSGSQGGLCFVEEIEDFKPLTVFVPEVTQTVEETKITTVATRATADHVVFIAHVPYSGELGIELLLNDQDSNPVYTQAVTTNVEAGLIAIQIPMAIAQTFTVGEVHRWYFQIDCGNQGSIHDYVEGDLVIVEPPSTAAPVTVDQVRNYAQAGIWLDTLYLSQQLRADAQGQEIWRGLLEQFGFAEFVDEPLRQQVLLPPASL
ncbi:DUF928 domain-containing protein [Spirulina major CS-329]|nr:DUF928 domain-containing protein [Spirulina major CS-329]